MGEKLGLDPGIFFKSLDGLRPDDISVIKRSVCFKRN